MALKIVTNDNIFHRIEYKGNLVMKVANFLPSEVLIALSLFQVGVRMSSSSCRL